jgi:hypothetical protein
MVKIIEAKNTNSTNSTFLKDDSDSDDEIKSAVQNFCSN